MAGKASKHTQVGDFKILTEEARRAKHALGVQPAQPQASIVPIYSALIKNSGFVDPNTLKAIAITERIYRHSKLAAALGVAGATLLASHLKFLQVYRDNILAGGLAVPFEDGLRYLEKPASPPSADQSTSNKRAKK